MNLKEQVIEKLLELGFQPELIDETFGYRFKYEGMNLLFSPEDAESKTIHLLMPGIFDVNEENRLDVLETIVKLAGKMKFVQPMIIQDSVWLNYQHYLEDHEPTAGLLEHMVRVLAYSTMEFHKILNNTYDDE